MQPTRHSLVVVSLLLWALALPATAQPPSPPAPATGSIGGIIRSAADDAPLARARVVASSSASAVAFVAMSSADGRYLIAHLPAGNYTITVSRTGYATEAFGRRRAAPAAQVIVAEGRQVTSIDVSLTPAGAIAGRILDEDGAPFAGATVAALESRFENGQHVLAEVGAAKSDDRGEFRIYGLTPGQYYVSAMDPAFADVGSERGAIRYAPTYYPGTSFSDEARPVAVAAGAAAPRVEFKLRLLPPSWVSGQLVTYDKHELLSGAVIMTPLDSDGSPVVPAESATLLPDGRFSFAAVPPGHYLIRARGQTNANGLALFSHFGVIVDGGDVTNVQMTLRRGALLEGEVAFEATAGTKPPALGTIRVRAPLLDGSGFGDALTGTVQSNRKYAIRGLMDGQHQIVIEGLERPWVVKSVLFRGADVTDQVIDAHEGQQFLDVRVTLTDRAADVSGRVQTARSAPAVDASVLVFPVAPQFWMRTNRRMRLARTDAGGQFTIYGLPPGEYLAIASYTVDEGDFGRTAVLDGLRAIATPFSIVNAASRPSLDLRLSPTTTAASTR